MSIDAVNINRLSDGIYVDVNPAFLDIIGYQREEVLGKGSLTLEIWADPADRLKLIEALKKDSVCHNLEARFRRKNGDLVWGLMSASLFELDGVPCVLSITRDITQAKATEERLASAARALQISEARYRTVFQTSLDCISISQLDDGKLIDVTRPSSICWALICPKLSAGPRLNSIYGMTQKLVKRWRTSFARLQASVTHARATEKRTER